MKLKIVLLSACVALTANANELNVGLDVRAEPGMKSQLTACLNSELQTLQDVVINERHGDSSYLLSVAAIRADAYGETPAVLVSVRGATRIFAPDKLSMDTSSAEGQHYQKAYEGYAAYTFLDVSVAAPLADLPELCKGIVAKFDRDVLDAERQVNGKIAREPSAEEDAMQARLTPAKADEE